MRALWLVPVVLLLAGCGDAPPRPPPGVLLTYGGDGCDEVAVLLPAHEAPLRAALPEGLEPQLRNGTGLLGVALNHCRFRAAAPQDAAWEAFAWASVEPPAAWVLAGAATHFFELAHWRVPGPSLDTLRSALPQVGPGAVTGLGPAFPPTFEATVRPAEGGTLRVNGTAAEVQQTGEFPPGPCCRIFAAGASGLVAVDLTSSPQPQGTARCSVAAGVPRLAAVVGAEAAGPCVHNVGFNFTAEVRALPPR